MRFLLVTFFIRLIFPALLFAQENQGIIAGHVSDGYGVLRHVFVELPELGLYEMTDSNGGFEFRNLPMASHLVRCTYTGSVPFEVRVQLSEKQPLSELRIQLQNDFLIDPVVVTGTRIEGKRSQSPVDVRILSARTLDRIQACQLSDGLNFQSGLRVETDCQTCNYTQLRMNGLGGGYSQILVNGHPVISSLAGLYSLEQIPSNMIDRVEVLRGGASALFGSNAIGGTVNIFTKFPEKNVSELGYTVSSIGLKANEHLLNANTSIHFPESRFGIVLFGSLRKRDWYDHNGDSYSELPHLQNGTLGIGAMWKPKPGHTLNWTIIRMDEFRVGGEMTQRPLSFRGQVEERKHMIWLGNADYSYTWNQKKQQITLYTGAQQTSREHFTGILPDEPDELERYQNKPPQGVSDNHTLRSGIQYHHKLSSISTEYTLGLEYTYDQVLDEIPAYAYLIDQSTRNLGAFVQGLWKPNEKLSLLAGLRADQHNFVEQIICSPRISAMIKSGTNSRTRITLSTGFRAPQAFDADMHVAFAGGGVSRIFLDPNLNPERSGSASASYTFDKPGEKSIYGFTVEAFYTQLNQVFIMESRGRDAYGEVFEKMNGSSSYVCGIHSEIRVNLNKIWQFESGYTLQHSRYTNPVNYIPEEAGVHRYLRTPDHYGYSILSWMPDKKWTTTIHGVYTGPMLLAHFAGSPENDVNKYVRSRTFADLGFKTAYTISLKRSPSELEIYTGVKNIFQAYQNDFDSGKNRDSNYVYGPATPRTLYIGLKLRAPKRSSNK